VCVCAVIQAPAEWAFYANGPRFMSAFPYVLLSPLLVKLIATFFQNQKLVIELCFSLDGRSRDSSVGIAVKLRAVRPRSCGSIPGKGKRFPFLYSFRLFVGTTKPPTLRVLGVFSQG
jgi:hypothetical protein